MINVYDFEVFKYDWLVVIVNPVKKDEIVIVNDPEKLREVYRERQNEIWVGYNSRHYDSFIMSAILTGRNPKSVNDAIIRGEKWPLQKVKLYDYDVRGNLDPSLKTFEGYMGESIKESSVPFDIDRKLTAEEIAETIKYCKHDVANTLKIFIERKADFDAHMGMIRMFNLPLEYISKTKVQLAAIILEAKRVEERDDDFDLIFPENLRIEKYTECVDFYKNPENHDYDKKLKIDIAGVPHVLAWGGLHGAIEKYSGEGLYINVDVASYYPTLMIKNGYVSRNMRYPKKYEELYKLRLKYKAEKNPLQAPLKIVLNGTYGAMKDQFNGLYDPRMANNVCVTGMLYLVDLIEKLEPHFQIIQSNTDGILVKIFPKDFELLDDICYEWENRTGMQLEFSEFRKVFQKDVNNYVIVDEKGNYKSKGAYVKKLSRLDYDLPIVNECLVQWFLNGKTPEETVAECDELLKFQKIVRITRNYKFAVYNGVRMDERTFRVFASKRESDGLIQKCKGEGKTYEKFANTPMHCFIENGNLEGVRVPEYLDRQYYVDLAKKRLSDFGVHYV